MPHLPPFACRLALWEACSQPSQRIQKQRILFEASCEGSGAINCGSNWMIMTHWCGTVSLLEEVERNGTSRDFRVGLTLYQTTPHLSHDGARAVSLYRPARLPILLAHTPLSSSFSSSDIGTPTSRIHLVDMCTSSSSQAPAPASSLAPNSRARQGVLKLPSTKRSARRKPAIACLFCYEQQIVCGAPPVGSADPTCK